MKDNIIMVVAKSYFPLKRAFLFYFLCTLVVSACSSPPATPTLALVPISKPTIVPSRPCELAPGETLSLAVTGVSGSGVTYSWSASAGVVIPPDGPAVKYTAPISGGDVFITVLAQKDGQTSDGMIICKIIAPTPLPIDTLPPATLAPTIPPTAIPTTWECTSYRSGKVQQSDISGDVKIDTPFQGTINIPSGQSIQVAGTYTGIPAGMYLWVFIYSESAGAYGRYYPQTKDAIKGWQPESTTGQDGGWLINVGFGAPKQCYEVIVMIADASASQAIADQLMRWATLNKYAGYELNGPLLADPPDGPGFPAGLVEKASIEVKTK